MLRGRILHWRSGGRLGGALTAAATALALSACGSGSGSASAAPTAQADAFPVGNLLNYANSDFEGHANFVPVANASISDSGPGFLHSHSLQDTVKNAGTSAFRLRRNVTVGVRGGMTYTVSAYVKLSSAAGGQSLSFGLGCYSSAGTWLGWSYTPRLGLIGSKGWQYSEGRTTLPSACARAAASPKLTFGGVTAGEVVNLDELTLRPARAALVIGAHGNTAYGHGKAYAALDWLETNHVLGPLQSDKLFFHALPSSWSNPSNGCYRIERAIPAASWPECVIAYKALESEAKLRSFLSGLPAHQQVVMVWWQEPENDSFFGCPGASGNGPNFVCYFEQQSRNIRQAAAGDGVTPEVLVGADSETYAYSPRSGPQLPGAAYAGLGCSFIPPSSFVDVYLADHYATGTTGNLAAQPGGFNWKNWLACVLPRNKPIGVAEFGVNPNGSNPLGSASAISADASYLAALPATTHEEIALWELWDAPGSRRAKDWAIDGEPAAVSAWRAAETQNGGG